MNPPHPSTHHAQRTHNQSKDSLGLLPHPHPSASMSSKLDSEKEGSLNNLLLELQIYPRLQEASVIVVLEYGSVASH